MDVNIKIQHCSFSGAQKTGPAEEPDSPDCFGKVIIYMIISQCNKDLVGEECGNGKNDEPIHLLFFSVFICTHNRVPEDASQNESGESFFNSGNNAGQ